MSDVVHEFCQMAEVVNEDVPFAKGLCGPKSLCVQAVDALLAGTSTLRQDFLDTLTNLDRWFAAHKNQATDRGDSTIPHRWTALTALSRSCFVDSATAAYGHYLRNAKENFDAVAEVIQSAHALDRMSTPGDPSSAEAADKELFSKVKSYLTPWTLGSWMTWDALCQMNHTAEPVAVEKTSVLFGGGAGQVLQLVVEALPGPAGLVTPNWWQLGLAAFPTSDSSRYLVGSVQNMLQAAVGREESLRLRWHLDADDLDAWRFGLDGRSLDAAAASVALAVLELRKELQERENGSSKLPPILDPQVAVTALVGNGEKLSIKDWPLESVRKETLPAKFAAAVKHNIDVVGVAADQSLEGVTIPSGLRVERLATVADALDLLRSVNRALDRYADYVRGKFHYYEEETQAND